MSEHYTSHREPGEKHIPVREVKEHNERLKVHHESAAEKADRNNVHEQQRVHHEAKEQAISGSEYHKPKSEQRQPGLIYTKHDKDHAFDTVMHHVQSELAKPERAFSKLIHRPAVEKTSEAIGKTIARPSGIIGATLAALVGLFSLYSLAKFAGFQLSGSEMPLLLVLGFGVGLLAEWCYKAVSSLIFNKVK